MDSYYVYILTYSYLEVVLYGILYMYCTVMYRHNDFWYSTSVQPKTYSYSTVRYTSVRGYYPSIYKLLSKIKQILENPKTFL